MFKAIIGQNRAFYDKFELAVKNIDEAAELLNDLFINFPDGLSQKVRKLKDLEHVGDTITHETIEMLNRTFVTPIDREDIYHLITKMDDIADLIDGTASRLELYKIGTITNEAIGFTGIIKKQTEILKHTISGMRNIKDYREIIRHCVELHTLENEGDTLMNQTMVKLFEEEKNDPVKLIKWKEIYANLESATDRCEDVANVVEGIAVKYA